MTKSNDIKNKRKEQKKLFLHFLEGKIPEWLMPVSQFFNSFHNGIKGFAKRNNILLESIFDMEDIETLKIWQNKLAKNDNLVYSLRKKESKTLEGLKYYILFLDSNKNKEPDILAIEEYSDYEEEDDYFEGEEQDVVSRRYERNRYAKIKCIEKNGCKCAACGFDFSLKYGERGEGYIEVHHIVPISQRGGSYKLNPETDLIPLCANCHRMIHRYKNEILSVEKLKELFL